MMHREIQFRVFRPTRIPVNFENSQNSYGSSDGSGDGDGDGDGYGSGYGVGY